MQTFTLTLSLQEVNTILAALDELPRKIGNPVYAVVAQQAVAQEQAALANQPADPATPAE